MSTIGCSGGQDTDNAANPGGRRFSQNRRHRDDGWDLRATATGGANEADAGGFAIHPETWWPSDHDTDHDGLADDWERAHGLEPSNAEDRHCTEPSRFAYTKLELFLNELAGDFEYRELFHMRLRCPVLSRKVSRDAAKLATW